MVHHAKRADMAAVGGGDRIADVESNVGLARHMRILRELLVEGRVGNDELLGIEDGVRAKGIVAAYLGRLDAIARLEKLAVMVDEDHARHRHIQDACGQPGDAVEAFFRRGIEQIQGPQCFESLSLVGRKGSGGHSFFLGGRITLRR